MGRRTDFHDKVIDKKTVLFKRKKNACFIILCPCFMLAIMSSTSSCSLLWCLCVVSGCAWHVVAHTPSPHHSSYTRVDLSCPPTPNRDHEALQSETPTQDDKIPCWIIVENFGNFVIKAKTFSSTCR
jgi:hypothetical protein